MKYLRVHSITSKSTRLQLTSRKKGVKEKEKIVPDYSWINQNRCGRVARLDFLVGNGGVRSLRVSGFFSHTRSPFSTSSVISASIRAIPTGAGKAGRAGRAGKAGGVSGLASRSSLSLLAAPLVSGILETVDAAVTGVDCCPCSVVLVPPVLGLLTCLERGRFDWGVTKAPRRGRFCGKRLPGGGALVEGLVSGKGFMRLDRARVTFEGNPVLVLFVDDWREGRFVRVKGWMPGR